MSVNINKVLLAGNLTRDPELKFFANERAVANFGLAVNRRYKGNDGEMKDETTFVDCEAWGRTAETIGQYLTKGRSAFIEGRLKLDSWEDSDGQKRSKIKVVVDNVQFLSESTGNKSGARRGSKKDIESNGDSNQLDSAPMTEPRPVIHDEDEPPF